MTLRVSRWCEWLDNPRVPCRWCTGRARIPALFPFDNTYARQLPGASIPWKPAAVRAPRLLYLDRPLADELGADTSALADGDLAALLSGNVLPTGAEPVAQAYAGHQFGGFSPQLGDGRALLLGEVIDRSGRRRDIAFKGSGRTPFSRGGDGKAAVGPMLREVLIGEAMHALGIPTTRALAVVATGEPVYREQALPGAVLTRVASSHLRVGTFQYFAARGDLEGLRRLADYAVARHDPQIAESANPPLELLSAVARRQAALIAQWMGVGFIHGVMNTDNMTISGETIDYGPCAFMEAFDPEAVFSSIDHGGRYAYANQPLIARWNLARLAEALLPLMADGDDAPAVERAVAEVTEIIDEFPRWYEARHLEVMRRKLGLEPSAPGAGPAGMDADDAALARDFLDLMQAQQVDFTLGWRRLADAAAGDDNPLRALCRDPGAPTPWLARWQARCAAADAADAAPSGPSGRATRAERLRQANPWVIPRNHIVEEALAAASDQGDMAPFEALLAALRRPFDETLEAAPYARPAPAEVTAGYRTFCGT